MQTIIGIVTNLDYNRLGMPVASVPTAYGAAIEQAGGLPLLLPYSELAASSAAMVELVAGLLFPGGIDIDPAWYREAAAPGLEEVNRQLDDFQMAALQAAIDLKKPILGICRGCQLINAALGGSLYQDLSRQFGAPLLPHRGADGDVEHPVAIAPGSRLQRLYGSHIAVNSRHHQAVKEPAAGLRVTAIAPDGVVEAMEHEVLPIHLVQWHPERMLFTSSSMAALFADFVEQCRKQTR